MRPQTDPEKLTLDVNIPVRPPRAGVNTAPGVIEIFLVVQAAVTVTAMVK